MLDKASFIAFPKIARLSRPIVITEKLDGTNAQIHIPDSGDAIYAGSRNRWITPSDDNYGFARWVEGNKNELLKLGPGTHYGEWWGAGIQRGYGLKEKRFSLFNTARWLNNLPTDIVNVVPLLYSGPFNTDEVDYCLELLRKHGSVASPGFMRPEGVVIYHTHGNVLFKKTLDKNDEHKG